MELQEVVLIHCAVMALQFRMSRDESSYDRASFVSSTVLTCFYLRSYRAPTVQFLVERCYAEHDSTASQLRSKVLHHLLYVA